jgi:hypothetical protein
MSMASKMVLSPRISEKGVPGFLKWAKRDSPALFAALAREFPEVAEFDSYEGTGSLMDNLSSIAGKIGSFVKNNALPILAAGVPLLVAQKQAKVALTQAKIAVANEAPARTAFTTENGYAVPVTVQQRAASGVGIPRWVWIGGAGAAAVGLLFLLSRRQ